MESDTLFLDLVRDAPRISITARWSTYVLRSVKVRDRRELLVGEPPGWSMRRRSSA